MRKLKTLILTSVLLTLFPSCSNIGYRAVTFQNLFPEEKNQTEEPDSLNTNKKTFNNYSNNYKPIIPDPDYFKVDIIKKKF